MDNKGFILTENKKFIKDTSDISIYQNKDFILLKVLYCGICGGDYSCYIGRRNEYPKSLGHEFVGEIVEIGENVFNYKCGDIVISDLNYRCGECIYCTKNESHLCKHNNIENFSNRAFYQYISIHQSYLVKLERSQFLYRYTLIEPLSCIIHAFNKVSTPKNILINGCGSIGMLAAFYSKNILNINNIYVYDVNKTREKDVSEYFDVSIFDNKEYNNMDLIFECSNSVSGVANIINNSSNGTNICFMSHLYGENTSFIYEGLCKKELNATFPLRNGKKDNLYLAYKIITNYWKNEYDNMLKIYDLKNIEMIFQNKPHLPSCKQILQVNNL